jgi:large subunit ribosomal protein L15
MQLHNLKRNKTNRASRQIGRGGKRGTTSGRGTKGQNARAGNKRRPEMRDIIKKLPKLRGYRFNSYGVKPMVLNLHLINKTFEAGEAVNPTTLLAKKLINKKSGKLPEVKILATGAITKALNFDNCLISDAAKAKIEQAGGSVTLAPVKE